jgi:hypothetical protein
MTFYGDVDERRGRVWVEVWERRTRALELLRVLIWCNMSGCKGTSIHFLTLTLLSYSPLVHMYLSHTFVPSPGTIPTKPMTLVLKVRWLSGRRLTTSCRHPVFSSAHTSAALDKHRIHGGTSTWYHGTLRITWTHGNGRLRGLVLYRTLYSCTLA